MPKLCLPGGAGGNRTAESFVREPLTYVRKEIIHTAAAAEAKEASCWLDLTEEAEVQLTSEAEGYDIENALSRTGVGGWRAAGPGVQTIRLLFKRPRAIRQIRLEFVENDVERNQEFALHYAEAMDAPLREILRQQWNFSPHGSGMEIEQYTADLPQVAVLQLTIDPDRGRNQAVATLNRWAVA